MAESNAFSHIEAAAPDMIFMTQQLFLEDKAEKKVALGIGAYRTNEGKPYVFPSVKKAEDRIVAQAMNKEYQHFRGNPGFVSAAQKLIFGEDSPALAEGRVATCQSLSGTGALRIQTEFIKFAFPGRKIYIPNPSWVNHEQMFKHAGVEIGRYSYFDPATRGLNFEGMLNDIKAADEGSIVLLHACAHNPTGVDPTKDQWDQVLEAVKSKSLIAFFDSAYQGFATGDLEADAYAVRLFVKNHVPMLLAQSFAKNMGLYGERVGATHVVAPDAETAKNIESHLGMLVRKMTGPCPLHGARIAELVLNDAELRADWIQELKGASQRILQMRTELRNELERLETPGDWTHITTQIGMFSFTGLTPEQVDVMQNDYHIYFTRNGRISVAGLNSGNVGYIAAAIKGSIEKAPAK